MEIVDQLNLAAQQARLHQRLVGHYPPIPPHLRSGIFPLINDFHQWGSCSRWENKDPAMKRSFSGPVSGAGAVYGWEGSNNVGSGRMEILEVVRAVENPDQAGFLQAVRGPQHRRVQMLPQGGATCLSWVMRGPSSFISKLMQVFMNWHHMIGKDFEDGRAHLKNLTEK